MADEQPKPGPSTDKTPSTQQTTSEATKVTSAAQPQQVSPGQEGVQVGGLDYTENEDGTRDYPQQEPVKTTDNPTPQPEQVDAEAPQATNQPAGQ